MGHSSSHRFPQYQGSFKVVYFYNFSYLKSIFGQNMAHLYIDLILYIDGIIYR